MGPRALQLNGKANAHEATHTHLGGRLEDQSLSLQDHLLGRYTHRDRDR